MKPAWNFPTIVVP